MAISLKRRFNGSSFGLGVIKLPHAAKRDKGLVIYKKLFSIFVKVFLMAIVFYR